MPHSFLPGNPADLSASPCLSSSEEPPSSCSKASPGEGEKSGGGDASVSGDEAEASCGGSDKESPLSSKEGDHSSGKVNIFTYTAITTCLYQLIVVSDLFFH